VLITLLILIILVIIILPEPWAAIRLFGLFLLPVLVAFWLMRRGYVRPAIILLQPPAARAATIYPPIC
jgi:hypothetical protein